MNDAILVDSGFLYALHDTTDEYYADATAFAMLDRSPRLIPEVALTEVAQLLRRTVGQVAVFRMMDDLVNAPATLQSINLSDIQRAREIMARYADARLDFVDCCIMALSERLKITRVCTFDRRDFPIFRPKHVDALELLP